MQDLNHQCIGQVCTAQLTAAAAPWTAHRIVETAHQLEIVHVRRPPHLLLSHLHQATSDILFHLRTTNVHSPKARVEHDPRASHVVFGGGEEAVFSQGHIADERQYEHGDAQDDQTQGLGGADHFGKRGGCSEASACVVTSRSAHCCRPAKDADTRRRSSAFTPPDGERRSGGCWWMRWPDAW